MSFYYNGNGTGGEWGMETGDWRLGNGRTYRWPWDCIPERGHRPQTIRLSDFRLWTAWTSCITPVFPLSCEAGKEGNAAANQQNAHHAK